MFYFHGAKGGNFAIVSDENLQINAHFIGTRPAGRTRDYTWVQALAIMFDSHTLVIAANKVAHWDDNVDALLVRWDGETDGDAFAHLETQFKFSGLSDLVEGVLGKTYRPDYVSPVKRGVPMPMMGGEDKYQTPSLHSTLCKACRFQPQPLVASI